MTKFRKIAAALVAALVALTMVGCGGSNGGSSSSKTIKLGYVPSWTDGKSMAYLMDVYLTKAGYKVEHQTLSEPAPVYTGLSRGDVSVYPSAWSEFTHKQYMDKYQKDITDMGAYYGNAKLTLAVPEYSQFKSIEDLKGKKDLVGGRIVGIEPGAGLTKQTKEKVMPEYGLEDYQLVTSSTTAMLTELKKATDSKQEIVVTLWRPFWANSKFPVRDLEDPKGALGKAEGLHNLANKEWADKNPEVAKWISGIKLTDEQYGELEDLVVNKYGEGKEKEAVAEWLQKYPNVVPAAPQAK